MPKMRLTDAAVQRIKAPPGQRVDYFDTLLGHGFALRVSGPIAARRAAKAGSSCIGLGAN